MNYEKVAEKIKKFEGYRAFPYLDDTGNVTVGYGHNLSTNGIGHDIALILLKQDIEFAEEMVREKIPFYKKLNEARQFVLIDMCFNMGFYKLKGFKKMLAALEAGDYKTAAKEMLDSVWARQVKSRAKKLAQIMETGEY